ncbi:MAG: phosphoenolpyruvate carboxylase [Candidatus Velthaea sp.]
MVLSARGGRKEQGDNERDTAAPLRARITYLGRLVGEVLQTHARPRTFEHVERLRLLTRQRRTAPGPQLDEEIDAVLDALETDDAVDVLRAFGLYFRVMNLAEQLHREHRGRERALAGDEPLRGSIETLGLDAAEGLDRLEISLVFTAHPTEVSRRTTSEKILAVSRLLRELDARTPTPEEAEAIEAELRAQMVLMWQSSELYNSAPTIHDEVRNLIARFRETLFDEATLLFERIETQVARPVPTFLSFGSWIGSDRDGNANVAPDAVVDAHEQARAFVLKRYLAVVETLQARFSQSISRGDVSEELLASVEHDLALIPDVRYTYGPRQESEPYRRKLAFVHRRLTSAIAGEPGGYATPEAFIADLAVIDASLSVHSGLEAVRPLRRLIRAIGIFGFHVYSLEWRQHRDRVVRALDEIVSVVEPRLPPLSERPAAERTAWFEHELISQRPLISRTALLSPDTFDIIRSLWVVADLRARRGPRSVTSFILAGTESADDILSLFALARTCGVFDAAPAQVVPLLESSSALDGGVAICAQALACAPFREHVAALGDVWEIMLGYSDGTKVAGIVSASWSIYRAQAAIAAMGNENGVAVRFFHGRGGSVGRGAADAREAVAAQPPECHTGRFKVTEQGEVIRARYGMPSLARRNLELAVTSVLNSLSDKPLPIPAAWSHMLDTLADTAQQSYLALIDDPEFLRFFAQATPVDEIGELEISSRPGRRGERRSINDLRAIPWAFGWAQSRCMLPGWYGFGTAVEAAGDELETLREMVAGFPFFANLVRSVERGLGVADMAIFARYAGELVDERELHDRFMPRILAEYERSAAAVLAILQQTRLLADDAVLARSIALRNPYVDPISLLQIRMLHSYRRKNRSDDRLRDAIRLSINGIAAGLRVTG